MSQFNLHDDDGEIVAVNIPDDERDERTAYVDELDALPDDAELQCYSS